MMQPELFVFFSSASLRYCDRILSKWWLVNIIFTLWRWNRCLGLRVVRQRSLTRSLASDRRPRSCTSSRLFRTFGWQAVNHQPTGHSQRGPDDCYLDVSPYRESLCPAKPGGGGSCLAVKFDGFRLGIWLQHPCQDIFKN